MLVVERPTHAPVECANAEQMMRVVIRVKRVALDLACVVLLRLVLDNLQEHIVMQPITYANVHIMLALSFCWNLVFFNLPNDPFQYKRRVLSS